MSKSKNHNKKRYDDNFDDEEDNGSRKTYKPRRQSNKNWTKTYLDHQDDEEYEDIFNGKQ